MNIDKQKLQHLQETLARYQKNHGSISTAIKQSTNCYTRCGTTCLGNCYKAVTVGVGS